MSAAGALARLHRKHGYPAVIRQPDGASVLKGDVLVSELPGSREQRRHGQEDVRLADVALLREDIGADDPPKDTTIAIAAGPHAATWVVLGIERRDELCLVVRCRFSARANLAAPGAREVVR